MGIIISSRAGGYQWQARIGDKSCGHWRTVCHYRETPLIEGSPDTFACWINASRVGDKAQEHICYMLDKVPIKYLKHQPVASSGDPVVFINWRNAFRTMDNYDCGDTQCEGCKEVVDCENSA
jgi:hypothetical protein